MRHALEVLVAVSLQAEQALRVASGHAEMVRTVASWTAAVSLVAVGVWIARRGPRAIEALGPSRMGQETSPQGGTGEAR